MSVRTVFLAVSSWTALILPRALATQTVTATTLPLKDKGAHAWIFFDSVVVGIEYGGFVTKDARIDAYSLTQPRLLWRQQDIAATDRRYEEIDPHTPDYGNSLLYIGDGPFAVVDVNTGAVRWKKSCDEAGFITRGVTQALGASKLLIAGSEKCKTKTHGDLKGNLEQEKRLMLVDRSTGQVIWTHNVKGREWSAGKLRARLLGGGYSLGFSFSVIPLAQGGAGGLHFSAGDDVDRLLVLGERLEAVSFADGHLLWQTQDEVGSPAGAEGRFVFFVKDDKLTAFDAAGTGAPAWSAAINASEATVEPVSPADSQTPGGTGPGDILVSTPKTLFRLELATGAQKWAINRQDADWELSGNLVLVASDDKVTAYDAGTGASRWELKGKRLTLESTVPVSGKMVGLFVDRGDYDKDADEWKGPFRFWGVDLTSGAVVWSVADLDGNKIVQRGLWRDGQVLRLWGDKTVKCRSLNIADGTVASAPPGGDDVSVIYVKDDKTLRAQTGAGDVVWERHGEPTGQEFGLWRGRGVVLWPLKSGTVEIIRLADGMSLWTDNLGGDPVFHADESGHSIVIPHGDKVTLLQVRP